ncbi:MAG: hypothetical protein KatS3mg115_1882 [Candidatus Poribacteria bacterium]|nr:MAG: hypothetical protein KatS3mg115_1882 [Candidatus Poribacteria bacterium]
MGLLVLLLGRFVAGDALAEMPLAIGQVQYDGGGDWYSSTASMVNWLRHVRERVGIPTEPNPRVVRLTDRDLYRTPLLYINGHGNIRFSDAEVQALRRYLEGGGFLFVNDDYGLDPSFRREIARVFPDAPLQPIPAEHPIYHCFYDLPGLPKVHEHDGEPAQGVRRLCQRTDGRLLRLQLRHRRRVRGLRGPSRPGRGPRGSNPDGSEHCGLCADTLRNRDE